MKKFLLFIGVLLILIVPKSVYAEDKEYFIDKLNIEAEILNNGDVVINELIEYRFNGNFNGVYRNLELSGSEGYLINGVSVIDSLGNTINIAKEDNGADNTYQINDNSNETQIKIFSKSSNESKMFKLNYTIKGAAKKYSDYSNLYWNFYNVKNIDSVKEGSLKIHLKDTNFEIDKLIYDIYGDGEITTSNTEKIITINFKELTSLIGIDMKFQKDYLSMAKEIIIPEENNNYNNNFNNYYKEEKDNKSTSIILIVFTAVCGIVGFFTLEKSKFNKEVNKYREKYIFTNEEFIMEPPYDLPPALVNLLINESTSSEEMVVTTLFYLANKGYYKMEEKESSAKKKNKDLIFTRINESKAVNYSHLEYIMDWFSDYEVNGSFSMKQIKKIIASNKGAKVFIKKLEYFLNKSKEDGEELGFYIKIRNKNILENSWYNEKKKWLAYKKYLQNIYKNNSINNESLNDLTIIYALALEISGKELEKIIKLSLDKNSLNNDTLNNSNSLYSFNYMNLNSYIFYMIMFNNMTNNAHEIVNPPTQTTNFNNSNDFFSGNDFNGGGGGDSGAF